MNLKFTRSEKQFWGRMVLVTGIAWPAGIILAIFFSYAVVNLFYPKETNLIVGLCLGAVVGYSQWFVLKKYFKVSRWWIWASTIGIGLPFVAQVIYMESVSIENDLIISELLGQIITLFSGGLLTGLLQFRTLKPFSKRSNWWIIISPLAWAISWAGFFLGGVILGLITGFVLLRFLDISMLDGLETSG